MNEHIHIHIPTVYSCTDFPSCYWCAKQFSQWKTLSLFYILGYIWLGKKFSTCFDYFLKTKITILFMWNRARRVFCHGSFFIRLSGTVVVVFLLHFYIFVKEIVGLRDTGVFGGYRTTFYSFIFSGYVVRERVKFSSPTYSVFFSKWMHVTSLRKPAICNQMPEKRNMANIVFGHENSVPHDEHFPV